MDDNIVRRHPVYKIGDSVKILNKSKRNKLEQSWKGPYEIIELLENNNIKIRNKDRIIRIYLDQCMPYFTGNVYIGEQAKVRLFYETWKLP